MDAQRLTAQTDSDPGVFKGKEVEYSAVGESVT